MRYGLILLIVTGMALAADRPPITIQVLNSHLYFNEQEASHSASVRALMPDGSEAILLCDSSGFMTPSQHSCSDLAPGKYGAEVKKNTVWIYVDWPTEPTRYDASGKLLPRKTRLEKVKYRIATAHN